MVRTISPADGEVRSRSITQGVADLSSPAGAELTEPCREDRFGDCGEVVERGHAVVVDALVGPDTNASRNVSYGARHWCNDDVVEHRDDLVTGNDEYGAAFVIRGFHQPNLGLGYHGSASVIAMALAIASSSSTGVWGCSRYDAAIDAPTRARRTDSARSWTPRRITAERFSAMPLATSSSMSASSSSLKRVGTGVVILVSIRNVEHGSEVGIGNRHLVATSTQALTPAA